MGVAVQKLSLITILILVWHIFETKALMETPSYQSQATNLDASFSTGEIREKRQTKKIELFYIFDLEVLVSNTTTVNHLRNIFRATHFPYVISNVTEITEVNLTTVCYLNGDGFQCQCEDQFAWSYNSCITYTPCDGIIQDTCGCINAKPSDGQSCHFQPNSTTLTNFTMKISFKIQKNFSAELSNQLSSIYKQYKQDIGSVVISNYKNLNGFVGIHDINFRNGSVITDFTVDTNNVDFSEIQTLNSKIASDLQAKDYNVDPNSFTGIIQAIEPFIKNYEIIYPGLPMELTYVIPESLKKGNASWFMNGKQISNDAKYTITSSPPKLTVKDMGIDDVGTYNFTLKYAYATFSHEEFISVAEVPPIIQMNGSSINVQCGGPGVSLQCCITYYNIRNISAKWIYNSGQISSFPDWNTTSRKCISASFTPNPNQCNPQNITCQVEIKSTYTMTATLQFFSRAPDCNDQTFGAGMQGNTSIVGCPPNYDGNMTAICEGREWKIQQDNCVYMSIKTLQLFSESLNSSIVPKFVADLNTTTSLNQTAIQTSAATVSSVVTILSKIAKVSENTSSSVMGNILETVSVLVSPETNKTWAQLNNNNTQNTSSALLESLENITRSLSSDSFNISTNYINLNKTTFTSNFTENFPLASMSIPSQAVPTEITTIVFKTLYFVLPNRTTLTTVNNSINGVVMLVYANRTINNNVSLTFEERNKTPGTEQCVFWNFKLFEGIGGWDDTGCTWQSENDDRVTCSCNHLTSFSILMSPSEGPDPTLDYITYIGVSISMACLVLCLIIEAFVWKVVTKNSTSYMRHVSIVNIAVSLLFADIWFIVGAAVSGVGQTTKIANPCSAATFFIHFFYLALFFWMLISALLLFYRTIMVFSHMSKSTMMAIAFTVGYGAPLIIAIITIAVTLPQNGYFRQNDACWLNWDQTKALLAFVIPALIIVVVNLLILIVVLIKLLMRGVGENLLSEEKNALMVIIRCVAVLTPIFGITWGLGIGTMVAPENRGVHITFALFNSLQGFFILVFGILFDSRIRSAIVGRFSFLPMLSTQTRSTSAGPSLSSWVDRLRRRRGNFYSFTDATASHDSSDAFFSS